MRHEQSNTCASGLYACVYLYMYIHVHITHTGHIPIQKICLCMYICPVCVIYDKRVCPVCVVYTYDLCVHMICVYVLSVSYIQMSFVCI